MVDTISKDGLNDLLETIAARADSAAARAKDAGDMAGWMPGTTVQIDVEVARFLVGHIRAVTARAEAAERAAEEMRAALVEWERSTTSYEAARGAEVWEAGPRMRAANAALEALARRLAEEKKP